MVAHINAKGAAVHRAFRRAVHIEQHHILVAGECVKFADHIGPQHLSRQQQRLERQRLALLDKPVCEHVEKRGRHVAQVKPALTRTGAKKRGILTFFVRQHVQALAAEDRHGQLLHRGVKRQGRNQPHPLAARRIGPQGAQNVHEVAVLNHHPLGSAC